MKVHDSRRFTGINIALDRPGAVIEVELEGDAADDAIRVWREQARRILDAVGWADQQTCSRKVEGGIMLALSSPPDTLYAATEVNDQPIIQPGSTKEVQQTWRRHLGEIRHAIVDIGQIFRVGNECFFVGH